MIHTGWPFPGPLQSFRVSDSHNDDSLLLDIEVSERESRGTTVESQSAVLANAFKLSQVKKQLTFIDLDLRRTGLIFYLNCTYSAESVSSDTEHYLFDYTFRLKKGSVMSVIIRLASMGKAGPGSVPIPMTRKSSKPLAQAN